MSTTYAEETISLDAITEITEMVPVGEYKARLEGVEGKLSKNQKPMVQASFEVVSGEQAGCEIRFWFSLSVTEKNGKKYASGVKDISNALAAVGRPLAAGFAFPLNAEKAAALFQKGFQGLIVDIIVVPDKRPEKDEYGQPTGKMLDSTRAKIVKSRGGSAATAGAVKSADPWDTI
jgi:hypothetical protein